MPMYSFTSPDGKVYEINGPEGSSREQAFNILQEGIKNGYYKPKSSEDRAAAGFKSYGDKALGAVDVGANLLSQMIGQPVSGLIAGASTPFIGAQKAEEFRKDMMENTFSAPPVSESGKKWNEAIGTGLNAVRDFGIREGQKTLGLIPGMENNPDLETMSEVGTDLLMNFAPVHAVVGGAKSVVKKAIPKEKTPTPTGVPTDIDAIIGEKAKKEQTPEPQPQPVFRVGSEGDLFPDTPENVAARDAAQARMLQENDAQYADPFNRIARELTPEEQPKAPVTPVDPFEQIKEQALAAGDRARYEQAQAAIDARNRQQEFETARQTILDRNAADRARQEQAPTGHEQWIEDLRNKAEERQPGNNTPMDFESPYPVDMADYPALTKEHIPAQEGIPYTEGINRQVLPLEIQDILGGKTPKETSHVDPMSTASSILKGTELAKKRPMNGGKSRGQRGAIDFDTFLDIIPKFRGTKATFPLFHGSPNEIKGSIKASKEGALGAGVYLAKRPEYASGYTTHENGDTTGGNVHQVYADIKNPLVIDGPGDPMIQALQTLGLSKDKAVQLVEKAYDEHGYIRNQVRARAQKAGYDGIFQYRNGQLSEVVAFSPEQVKSAISPDSLKTLENSLSMGDWEPEGGMNHSQRGGLNIKDISESLGKLRSIFGNKGDRVDHPISQEMMDKKDSNVRKLKALDEALPGWAKGPTTLEEAIAKGKEAPDIKSTKTGRALASGIGQMQAWHEHPVLAWASTMFLDARAEAKAFSKNFITGKDGVAPIINDLTTAEKVRVSQIMHSLDKHATELTPELMDKLSLSKNERAFLEAQQRMSDANYEALKKTAELQGREPPRKRISYSPGIFDGTFQSLVLDANGKVKGFIGAYSRGEYELAKAHYESKGLKVVKGVGEARKPLVGNQNRGFAMRDSQDVLNMLAKVDGDFAEFLNNVKESSDAANQKLWGMHHHELAKKGISGNVGNKPWLSPERNAKQHLDAMIRYFEESAEYHSLQNPLAQIELASKSADLAHLKNVWQSMDDYVAHITGRNISPVGTALNWVFDIGADVLERSVDKTANTLLSKETKAAFDREFGLGRGEMLKASNWVKNKMALMYMGFFNWTFMMAQMIQPIQSGIPMLYNITNKIDGRVMNVPKSLFNGYMDMIKHVSGKPLDAVGEAALKYGMDRGLFDFTEIERAYEGHKYALDRNVDRIGEMTMAAGERLSRQPAFFSVVRLLTDAGYDVHEALPQAEKITNQIMGDFHPWERPQLYSGLGVVAPHAGGLTTFKHNYMGTQAVLAREAKRGNYAPMATSLGMVVALAGIQGAPFYQDADVVFHSLTGKHISEVALTDLPQWAKTGMLSSATGMNWQGKFSSADMVPDNLTKALFPYLTGAWDIGAASVNAIKDPSKTNLANLAMTAVPATGKRAVEAAVRKDENGNVLDKNQQVVGPRSESDWWKAGISGLTPLNEAVSRNSLYERKDDFKWTNDKLKTITDGYVKAIRTHEDPSPYIQEYVKQGGNLQELYNAGKQELSNSWMNEQQRAEGVPKSAGGLRRYDALKER